MRLRVLVAVAAVALAVAGVLLSRSSLLHARGVAVIGASHLSRADVVRAAGVSRSTNVVWLDEGAVERRLESQAWVDVADVRVAFPWTIEITIVERVPVAVASDGLRETLVAADGTALGPADRDRGLPRIELPRAFAVDGVRTSPTGAAVAVGSMSAELRERLASVSVLADGTLDLRLRGGVGVRYGSASEPRRKAAVLERILAWAEQEGMHLAAVNVVAPDLPAVRIASGGP
jgi:cell division protein FtsQ